MVHASNGGGVLLAVTDGQFAICKQFDNFNFQANCTSNITLTKIVANIVMVEHLVRRRSISYHKTRVTDTGMSQLFDFISIYIRV